MKLIEKLDIVYHGAMDREDFAENVDELRKKQNEIIDRLNEICLKLFPSTHPQKENKGYVDQELTKEEVEKSMDPNDRI